MAWEYIQGCDRTTGFSLTLIEAVLPFEPGHRLAAYPPLPAAAWQKPDPHRGLQTETALFRRLV